MLLTDEMIIEVVDGLTNIFQSNIQAIILYGSVARGTQNNESDIDIAIIINKKVDKQTHEEFISWTAEMDLKYDKVFSIVDIDRDKFEEWGEVLPFYRNIKKEGVILWKTA